MTRHALPSGDTAAHREVFGQTVIRSTNAVTPWTRTLLDAHSCARGLTASQGLGANDFGYLDSLADTGDTPIPSYVRLRGNTASFGDPRTIVGAHADFSVYFRQTTRGMLGSFLSSTWSTPVTTEIDILYIIPRGAPVQRVTESPKVLLEPLTPANALGAADAALPLPKPDTAVEAIPSVGLVETLRRLRSQAGLPVGDLAAMLGVSRRQFYNWISAENTPDVAQHSRIARTAALIEEVRQRVPNARAVREQLLSESAAGQGSVYAALRNADLVTAQLLLESAGPSTSGHRTAPSVAGSYDRTRVLDELEALRDGALRGDD